MATTTPRLVDAVVSEVAGNDVLPIVKALKNRKNVSEFALAERIRKEINLTRNMLYRLHNANLVSFTRKKDKKKGWYIYYWTFNANRVKELMHELKQRRFDRLRERLEREGATYFFICANRCVRLDFEQATDFQFKCPECGLLLNQEENGARLAELRQEIAVLQKELKTNGKR